MAARSKDIQFNLFRKIMHENKLFPKISNSLSRLGCCNSFMTAFKKSSFLFNLKYIKKSLNQNSFNLKIY